MDSFDGSGFTVSATGGARVNSEGDKYVAFGWKEGKVHGLDIVTYTGDGTSPRTVAPSTPAGVECERSTFFPRGTLAI